MTDRPPIFPQSIDPRIFFAQNRPATFKVFPKFILLMAEILHQLIGSLSHDLQRFIHPRWLAGFLPSTVVPQPKPWQFATVFPGFVGPNPPSRGLEHARIQVSGTSGYTSLGFPTWGVWKNRCVDDMERGVFFFAHPPFPNCMALFFCVCYPERATWRIIPVSKWLITMVNKCPKDRVVGPLPNGRFRAYKWGAPSDHHVSVRPGMIFQVPLINGCFWFP